MDGGQILEEKLANSHHKQSRCSHACVSCLSPVKVAEAPSLSQLGKREYRRKRRRRRREEGGGGTCTQICLREIFMSVFFPPEESVIFNEHV